MVDYHQYFFYCCLQLELLIMLWSPRGDKGDLLSSIILDFNSYQSQVNGRRLWESKSSGRTQWINYLLSTFLLPLLFIAQISTFSEAETKQELSHKRCLFNSKLSMMVPEKNRVSFSNSDLERHWSVSCAALNYPLHLGKIESFADEGDSWIRSTHQQSR